MLVQDAMTPEPRTVVCDARIKEAVTVMAELRVSALPVVDSDGRICGIVTEADLIRGSLGQDPRVHEMPRREHGRSHALLVSEVMTSPAITAGPRSDLSEVVELMTSARLKSLPVVDDDGQVVGMVSRSDVVRIRARPDQEIEDEVAALVRSLEHPDWSVEVRDGIVVVAGPQSDLDRSIAEVVASSVAGVVAVQVS